MTIDAATGAYEILNADETVKLYAENRTEISVIEIITVAAPTSIKLNADSTKSLGFDENFQLTVTTVPENTPVNLKYTRSYAPYCPVSATGLITAKTASATPRTITVTANGGAKATVQIVVTTVPTYVTISGAKVMVEDAYLQLTAKCTPGTAGSFNIWSSGNEEIATVDQQGRVFGVKAGIVTITAKTYNGKTATYNDTVYSPNIAEPTVSAMGEIAYRNDPFTWQATKPADACGNVEYRFTLMKHLNDGGSCGPIVEAGQVQEWSSNDTATFTIAWDDPTKPVEYCMKVEARDGLSRYKTSSIDMNPAFVSVQSHPITLTTFQPAHSGYPRVLQDGLTALWNLVWMGGEDEFTASYQVDGGQTLTYTITDETSTGSRAYTADFEAALTEGDHTVKLWLTDNFGISSDAITQTVHINEALGLTLTPDADITAPLDYAGTTAINWTIATVNPYGTGTLTIGDETITLQDESTPYVYAQAISAAGDGAFTVTVTDAAGNTAGSSETFTVEVKELKMVSVTADTDEVRVGSDITWTAVTEGGGRSKAFSYTVYNGETALPAVTGSSTYAFSVPTEGVYRVQVTCTDELNTTPTHAVECANATDAIAADAVSKTELTYEVTSSGVKIMGYTGSAASVKLPEIIDHAAVNEIGAGALANNTSMIALILPSKVDTIGDGALAGCLKLGRLELSGPMGTANYTSAKSGLATWFGSTADAAAMKTVTFPDNITTVGAYLLADDAHGSGITTVVLPNTVETIREGAFKGLSSLSEMTAF